jgi:hypothetical protein
MAGAESVASPVHSLLIPGKTRSSSARKRLAAAATPAALGSSSAAPAVPPV